MTDPIAPDDAVTTPRFIDDDETRVVDASEFAPVVQRRVADSRISELLTLQPGIALTREIVVELHALALEIQQRRAATEEYLAALADWDLARWSYSTQATVAARVADALAALIGSHKP